MNYNNVTNINVIEKDQLNKKEYDELSDRMTDCIYLEWIFDEMFYFFDRSKIEYDYFYVSVLRKIKIFHITIFFREIKKTILIDYKSNILCHIPIVPLLSKNYKMYTQEVGEEEALKSVSIEFISDSGQYGPTVAYGFAYDSLEFRKLNIETGLVGELTGVGRL